MGNIVGRVRYRLSRPFREYNLEERAFKAVNRNKEVASPRHPSTTSHIEKIIKNLNPKIKEQLETTNPKFDSRLRQVFVTSKDVTPIE
ncbi:NADH dehydrogenase [ubiquinone] 1 alpha subcomplex assembly factor 4, partial [Trinorchestia longiramus]